MVTREINITLPTGVEARFNIVAETSFNDLTVKFQDLDGYDGAEIYSETLDYIEYEPDNLIGVTSTIDITGDENVAEGLLDEIGLKSQAGDFNYKDGYDLYKVNIKPDANVVNIPNKAIFVEFGIEKEMSSDFIQGFIERPKVIDSYKNVTQIKIDGKTYDITDTFTSSQALQEHFKNADVLVYTNDIEDVGSKSYMFLNENSYVLEKINDAQFNVDVANKYIKNNPYEKELKLARKKSFIEPERYQVLLNALLDETDTPTNVVDNGRLVWGSEEFIDAILDDMRASAQLLEFDMEGDFGYLKRNQPEVAKQIEQGKINIANHIDFIEVTRETLDRTDLPPGLDKFSAQDEILMFVEAAQYEQRTQGTGKI